MNLLQPEIIKLSKLCARLTEIDFQEDGSSKEVNKGSGILFNLRGNTYLLTAGHCLRFNKKLKIEVQVSKYVYKTLSILGTPVANQYDKTTGKDYAILKVGNPDNGFLDDDTVVLREFEDESFNVQKECKYIVFGYPTLHNNRNGFPFNVQYRYPDSWQFTDKNLYGPYDTFKDVMEGISGSGVVTTENETFHCAGILTNTFEETGILDCIRAVESSFLYSLICEDERQQEVEEIPVVPITDNSDYIQRYCSTTSNSDFMRLVNGNESRYTLIDYVRNNVPNVLSFRYLLTADAQTGKSYELRHLVSQMSHNGYAVIYIQCKDVSSSLTDILPSQKQINAQKVIVVIDALDELLTPLDENLKGLSDFVEDNLSIHIVVSCRNGFDVQQKLSNFTHLFLEDLTIGDAKRYVEGQSEFVQKRLQSYFDDEEKRALLTNPFFLKSLVTQAQLPSRRMPDTKAELYDMFVNQCQPEERSADATAKERHDEKRREDWRKVAYIMLMTGNACLSKDEIATILGNDLGLPYITNNRNLFTEVEGRFGFVNNALKELLAAEYLLRQDLTGVQASVCHYNSLHIKPQWYNTIILWLQKLVQRDGVISGEVLEWVTKSAKQLLLYSDPAGLSDDVRLKLVISIIEEHKRNNTFIAAIYQSDYKHLCEFAPLVGLATYMLEELKSCSEPSRHLYNLFCTVTYLDWDKLQETDKNTYVNLVECLLQFISKIGGKEECDACFYFTMYGNASHFIDHADWLERLMPIVKDFSNHEAINAMAYIIYKSNKSDVYCDYLLEKESSVHSFEYRIVPRSTLYLAFGNVCEQQNIETVLARFTDLEYMRKEGDTDDYKNMISRLLANLLYSPAITDETKRGIIDSTFLRIYNEESIYYLGRVQELLYDVFVSMFDQYSPSESVLDRWREIEDARKPKPEEDERRRQLWQNEYDEFTDYDLFKSIVLKCVEEAPQGCTDIVSMTCRYSSRWLRDFAIHHAGTTNRSIEYVRQAILDEHTYALYRMYVTADVLMGKVHKVEANETQRSMCLELATDILRRMVEGTSVSCRWEYKQQVIRLVITEFIQLKDDELLALLPMYSQEYATMLNTEPFEKSSKTLFAFCIEKVAPEKLQGFIAHQLASPGRINEPTYLSFAKYIVAYGSKAVKDSIYKYMFTRMGSGLSDCLFGTFSEQEDYIDKLIEDFNNLSDSCQNELAQKLKESDQYSVKVKNLLEERLDYYDDFEKKRALHSLFTMGSMKAIRYASDNLDSTFTDGEFFIFKYSEPEALPHLLLILPFVIKKGGIYQSVANSILVSMANIAETSKDNLYAVVKGIEKIVDENSEMSFLLNNVKFFKERYMQRRDVKLSLDEAVELMNR